MPVRNLQIRSCCVPGQYIKLRVDGGVAEPHDEKLGVSLAKMPGTLHGVSRIRHRIWQKAVSGESADGQISA